MRYKILVIDDEADVRQVFSEMLTKERHIVATAVNAEEGMQILEKEDFDAVLLDIKLPGISGFEAIQKIKQLKPHCAVIMITGLGYEEALISKCMAAGCNGYIGKDMPISQILSTFELFIKSAKEKEK